MVNSKFSKGIGIVFFVLAVISILSALAATVDAYCGDGLCNNGETCATCSNDCGSCGPICGNSVVETGEQCERPSTSNNLNCGQSTSACSGVKTGTRDAYGNCDSSCDCAYDSFANYRCIKGSCGATCDGNEDCPSKCVGSVYHSSGSCSSSSCSCSYTTTDCNTYDGWYDTSSTKWVSTGQCTEKQQKEQKHRDYSCSSSGCTYSVTQTRWVDTGSTRNKADGTSCNDNLFCTVNDVCASGTCSGSSRSCDDGQFCTVNDRCDETQDKCVYNQKDCSASNLPEIKKCNNNPDNNPFTWDYAAGFTSVCDEANNRCTTSTYTYTHTCDKTRCGAECTSNSDCNDGNSHTTDTCLSGCTCSHTPQPYCGDGQIDFGLGEECELPNTQNNIHCCQSASECSGKKTGTRDAYGNCDSECGCVQDPFTNYRCIKDSCGAECAVNSDCDDGNPHTVDTCLSGCTCSHSTQPYCGDGQIDFGLGEECELPNTQNNIHCCQSASECSGKKTGTRDAYGNCDSECGCVQDPFTNYRCIKDSCGAECAVDSDCDDGNPNTADTCLSGCTCAHECIPSQEICDGKDNDCDGLVDEDLFESCGSGVCSGTKTCTNGQWSECSSDGQDAGTCAICSSDGQILYDPTQDSDCDNSLFCDGQESCMAIGQCQAGTPISCGDSLFCTVNERCDEATDSCVSDPRDCSGNDLPTIATCCNEPDGNPFTWDYAEGGFASSCDEAQDICTQGQYGEISHECSTELCGAECESDSDCIAGHSCSGCECTCSPSQEICDGLDNDCDSRIDEDNVCGPKIISTPVKRMCVTKAGENSDLYTYDVDAVDPDDQFLTYVLLEHPDDMFIDPSTGIIYWQFGQGDIGNAQVIVRAEDQEFTRVPGAICPDIVDPVCGENGNTFINLCELAAAGQGLWHYGYCYDMQAYELEICKPGEEIYPRRKLVMDSLSIMNAEPICAGDELEVMLTLENGGIFDNKDIKASFVLPELVEKRTIGPFRLDNGEETTKIVRLYVPEDTPNGLYELRVYIYAQNGDFHRIKHRDFIVVQCSEYSCRRDNPLCYP